jgi:hypothetical protein
MISVGPAAELSVATMHDIENAADGAYTEIARRDGLNYSAEEVHYRAVCVEASILIARSLLARGYPVHTEHVVVYPTGQADDLGIGHTYCVLEDEEQPETVFDGTWQQFLPYPLRGQVMPTVLAGGRQEVIRQARTSGITDETVLALWLPASQRPKLHPGFDNRDSYL